MPESKRNETTSGQKRSHQVQENRPYPSCLITPKHATSALSSKHVQKMGIKYKKTQKGSHIMRAMLFVFYGSTRFCVSKPAEWRDQPSAGTTLTRFLPRP